MIYIYKILGCTHPPLWLALLANMSKKGCEKKIFALYSLLFSFKKTNKGKNK